jgi:hypothetical protein
MSGKLGLDSTGRNVETLDLVYRLSRCQRHAFNPVPKVTYTLQRNPKVRYDEGARIL